MKYLVAALIEYTIDAAEDDEDAIDAALAKKERQLKKIGVSVGSVESVERYDEEAQDFDAERSFFDDMPDDPPW